MEDISDFSLEKMQNVVAQGAHFNDATIEACMFELKKKGLLTDFQIQEHKERIALEKSKLDEQIPEINTTDNKSYTFEWKTQKGEKGEFKPGVPSIDSFFFATKVLSIKNPSILQWVGKPLGKGETLVFMWENTTEGRTVPMEVSTTLGAPIIEIPAAKMAQIGLGDWSLYLVRKRFEKAELADFLIESSAEFYTKPMLVKIGG